MDVVIERLEGKNIRHQNAHSCRGEGPFLVIELDINITVYYPARNIIRVDVIDADAA